MVGTATCSENLCDVQRRTDKTGERELGSSGFKGKQLGSGVADAKHV